MGSCQVLLNIMKEKDIKLEDDPEKSYIGWLKTKTLRMYLNVLPLALKSERKWRY